MPCYYFKTDLCIFTLNFLFYLSLHGCMGSTEDFIVWSEPPDVNTSQERMNLFSKRKTKKCYSNLKRGQPKVVLPDNHIATFISSEIEHSFQMSLPLSGLHSIMFWLAFNDQIPKFTTLLLQITSKSTLTSNISECKIHKCLTS